MPVPKQRVDGTRSCKTAANALDIQLRSMTRADMVTVMLVRRQDTSTTDRVFESRSCREGKPQNDPPAACLSPAAVIIERIPDPFDALLTLRSIVVSSAF